jgi:hypothetical protein
MVGVDRWAGLGQHGLGFGVVAHVVLLPVDAGSRTSLTQIASRKPARKRRAPLVVDHRLVMPRERPSGSRTDQPAPDTRPPESPAAPCRMARGVSSLDYMTPGRIRTEANTTTSVTRHNQTPKNRVHRKRTIVIVSARDTVVAAIVVPGTCSVVVLDGRSSGWTLGACQGSLGET